MSDNDREIRGGANRRKLARIKTSMQVDVYRRGWLNSWRLLARAQAVDYNRYGIGIVSPVKLAPGRQLSLDLFSGAMTLRGINAEVVSCRRSGKSFRVGLRTYHNLRELAEHSRHHQLRYLAGMELVLDK